MANDPTEFAQLLLTHAKGRAHDAATKLLKDAVEAVKLTGKKGEVAIKLTIHPVKNNEDVVRIEDRVTATIPEETRASIWYTDDDGQLHRNDPTQRSFFDADQGVNTSSDGKSAAAGKDS